MRAGLIFTFVAYRLSSCLSAHRPRVSFEPQRYSLNSAGDDIPNHRPPVSPADQPTLTPSAVVVCCCLYLLRNPAVSASAFGEVKKEQR